MSSENDETCLIKAMWCQFGDMRSLNLKWGANPDGQNCISIDRNWFWGIQEYISYLLLHAQLFKSKIRRQGLCLEWNLRDEMGQHNLGHCTKRNEHFKENWALGAGGDDNNANGDEGIEKAKDLPRDWGKNPTWFELLARILDFCIEIKEQLSNTEFATWHGMSHSWFQAQLAY